MLTALPLGSTHVYTVIWLVSCIRLLLTFILGSLRVIVARSRKAAGAHAEGQTIKDSLLLPRRFAPSILRLCGPWCTRHTSVSISSPSSSLKPDSVMSTIEIACYVIHPYSQIWDAYTLTTSWHDPSILRLTVLLLLETDMCAPGFPRPCAPPVFMLHQNY